jgi:phosphatidylserine decarboxylase
MTVPIESPATSSTSPVIEPLPSNIRSTQPGGGTIQAFELEWGRLRRALLWTFFPQYVRRMKSRLRGDPSGCPVEIIDSRDLKYFRNVCNCGFDPSDDRFAWRNRIPFARPGLAELLLGCGGLILGSIAIWASGHPYLALAPLPLVAFVLWFFRDPERAIPAGPDVVVSPADGTVVDISRLEGHERIGEPIVRVGIFLSVFNVHVNRAPRRAQVVRLEYRPGKFINALFAESADENERMEIDLVELEAPSRRMIVRQIAGAIARRIVCQLRPGEIVRTGERIGMIKFGSRTELLLPEAGLELSVKVGDKIRGGATCLGRYKSR